MDRFFSVAVALLLATPLTAGAQDQVPPTDQLGAIAWQTMQSRTSEMPLPTAPGYSTQDTVDVAALGGTLAVTFGASTGDTRWTLQSYAWRPDGVE